MKFLFNRWFFLTFLIFLLVPSLSNPAEKNELMLAVRLGDVSKVKELLESGTELMPAVEEKDTPLIVASKTGNKEIVSLLLDHGSDVNAEGQNGWTALHHGAFNGLPPVVTLLIDSGANVNQAAKSGLTPLIGASYKGHYDVVNILLDHNATVNAKDHYGWTPLYIASRREFSDIVKILVGRGAFSNIKSVDGKTAIDYAFENNNEEIISILKKAQRKEKTNKNVIKLSLPKKNWALGFDFEGFKIIETEILPEGNGRYLSAENKENGFFLSVFLEIFPNLKSSIQCRENYWSRLKDSSSKKENIEFSEENQKAMLEYFIMEEMEIQINQKHKNVYLNEEDVCVDIHLSKVKFQPKDELFLNQFIENVEIDKNWVPNSFDNLAFGSFYYINKKYDDAISYYEKSLEKNKADKILNKVEWRVLIDNLGMAYGISGKFEEAKGVFEYGISVDPDYPMFYYNLAATYAEMGNIDDAIPQLREAFNIMGNLNSGEQPPDPENDPSFQPYLEFEQFLSFLNEIKL